MSTKENEIKDDEIIESLKQSLLDLGFSKILTERTTKDLGRISSAMFLTVALLFSPFSNCDNYSQLMSSLGVPPAQAGVILGNLSYRQLRRKFRRAARKTLFRILREKSAKSKSTQSRWQVTWVWDATTLRKFLESCNIQGDHWSGQFHQVVSGIEIFVLYAVFGDGQFSIPMDFHIRYPDTIEIPSEDETPKEETSKEDSSEENEKKTPKEETSKEGSSEENAKKTPKENASEKDSQKEETSKEEVKKITHTEGPALCLRMLASLKRAAVAEGIKLIGQLSVADAWFTSTDWFKKLGKLGCIPCGPAKSNWVLYVPTPEGDHKCKVKTLREWKGFKFKSSSRLPKGIRYFRIFARNPTFGEVVVTVFVHGKRITTLFSYDKSINSVRLIRAYLRRCKLEHAFKILKSFMWIDGYASPEPKRQLNHFVFRFGLFVIVQYAAQLLLEKRITFESMILRIRRIEMKGFRGMVDQLVDALSA